MKSSGCILLVVLAASLYLCYGVRDLSGAAATGLATTSGSSSTLTERRALLAAKNPVTEIPTPATSRALKQYDYGGDGCTGGSDTGIVVCPGAGGFVDDPLDSSDGEDFGDK